MGNTNPTPAQARCRTPDNMAKMRLNANSTPRTLDAQLARAELKAARLRERATIRTLKQKAADERASKAMDRLKMEETVAFLSPRRGDKTVNVSTMDSRLSSLEQRLTRLELELGVRA
jgi:hypothetical protein